MSKDTERLQLSIGSQTNAQKARKELIKNKISAKVIKVESRLRDGGCLFGVEIDRSDSVSALKYLRDIGLQAYVVS